MWEYLLAALVGLGAAAVVFFVFATSGQTDCYRESVTISISHSNDTLPGCDFPAFDEVREQVSEQRDRRDSDEGFGPNEPEPVRGNATLVVWISLFSATAGLAGFSAVRSIYMICLDMKPRWRVSTNDIVASGGLTFLILLVPYLSLRMVGDWDLSPFDELHMTQIRWMTVFVLVLSFPAATGLRVIGHILRKHADLAMDDVAVLGSQLRTLISMLGGIVSLAVLGTAARWQAIDALPGGESVPGTIVLLWGGVYALALAALYIPVHERWASAARRTISLEVARQVPPSETAGTIGFTIPELSARKELQSSLGLGGALSTLQGSLAVLAPIIAAAASSLFS
jgi:hypothetical protein